MPSYESAVRKALIASDKAARISYSSELHEEAANLWKEAAMLATTKEEVNDCLAVQGLELSFVQAIEIHLGIKNGL